MKICRRYITTKNGIVLDAHNYGKDAFCFEVSEEENQKYWEEKEKKKQSQKKDKMNNKKTDKDVG